MNDVIAETGQPIDTNAVAEYATGKAEQLAGMIDASVDGVALAIETRPLTPNLVEDRICSVMAQLHTIFFDPEQRQKGDNGYAYRLDYDGWDNRTDGAQPTGEIVTVDRLSFLGAGAARALCSGLDFMLSKQSARSAKLRNSIQSTFRFGHRTGSDMATELAEAERKLANSVEQEALITIALNKAVEQFHALTGQFYENAKDREASAKAAAQTIDPAQRARLAGLGVTVG